MSMFLKQYLYVFYIWWCYYFQELDLESVFIYFAGGGASNHLEQEADLTTLQELGSEVRPLVSQQQDETLSHNVATLDQSGTLVLGREYQHFFIKPKWRFSFVS